MKKMKKKNRVTLKKMKNKKRKMKKMIGGSKNTSLISSNLKGTGLHHSERFSMNIG